MNGLEIIYEWWKKLHKKRSTGCEFCDNGEHLSVYDKYGFALYFNYCPMCGKELEHI